jgi:hypothetical protein
MICKVRDGGRWWYKSGFVYAFNYELCEMPVTYPSHNIRTLVFFSKWLKALCRLLLRCWHAFRRWLSNSLDLQVTSEQPAGKPWMRSVSCRADFSKPPHWKHKPDWVRAGVLQLARELPKAGYRTIANCFNLQQAVLHGDDSHGGERMTVSKSYVAKLVTANRLALSATRASALVRRARMGEIQTTWGLDMTVLNGGERTKMKDSCSERAAQMVRCHHLARGVRNSVREDVAVRHEAGAADAAAVCKRAAATQLRDGRFTGKSINRFTNAVRAIFCGGLEI